MPASMAPARESSPPRLQGCGFPLKDLCVHRRRWAVGTVATQRLNPGPLFPAAMDARRRDTILVLLASVLWGTSFPGSKLTVGTVDPLFLSFARMALGALLGLTVLAAIRRLDLRVFREPLVWVLGAINAVGFELQNEGILLTTALLATVPLFFVGWPLPTNANGWLGIAYLGLVPTFTPLLLYVASMRTISPTVSGLLILLEVVVAAVLSFLFLRDPLGVYTLAGGALILFGAYVVTRGDQPMPEPAAGGLASVPSETIRDAGRIIRR